MSSLRTQTESPKSFTRAKIVAAAIVVLAGTFAAPARATDAPTCTVADLQDALDRREGTATQFAERRHEYENLLGVTAKGAAVYLGSAGTTEAVIAHVNRSSGVSRAKLRIVLGALRKEATVQIDIGKAAGTGVGKAENHALLIETFFAGLEIADLVASKKLTNAEGQKVLAGLASATASARVSSKERLTSLGQQEKAELADLDKGIQELKDCLSKNGEIVADNCVQSNVVTALFSASASFSAGCPVTAPPVTAPPVTAAPVTAPPVTAAPPTTVRAAAALALVGPRLFQPGENGTYHQYRYSATSGGFTLTNSPTDIRDVQWDFTGVPTALIPGTEFTITVAGKLTGSPGVEAGANYTGAVSASGLTVVKQQNAFFYQGQKSDGIFTYRVPIGATKAQIGLGGDWGIGTFAIYCYGACS